MRALAALRISLIAVVMLAPAMALFGLAQDDLRLASASSNMKPLNGDYRRIVINTQARTLTLYAYETAVATYPVGVGRPGFATPVGQYKVIRMMKNPGWENPYQKTTARTRIAPGGNNPLGTRWIGFLEDGKGEFGIHGTDNPASVGKYSSHGCVRMYIQDAEALYDQVAMGTSVEVVSGPHPHP